MVVIIELFHYILRQLIESPKVPNEDESFSNFKELLLRHAVHRPPHSTAILTFDDVKKISNFALDSFFRHFDMYRFCMTNKEEMTLKTGGFFTHQSTEPKIPKVEKVAKINFSEG